MLRKVKTAFHGFHYEGQTMLMFFITNRKTTRTLFFQLSSQKIRKKVASEDIFLFFSDRLSYIRHRKCLKLLGHKNFFDTFTRFIQMWPKRKQICRTPQLLKNVQDKFLRYYFAIIVKIKTFHILPIGHKLYISNPSSLVTLCQNQQHQGQQIQQTQQLLISR